MKAEENDVQNEIEITVYSKVTDILIDQKEVFIPIGDNFKINAYTQPDDANNKQIIYESQNRQIATVDENGIITAHSEGEAIILAISEENPEVREECKVIVVRKMNNSEINFDIPLKLNSLEITGIYSEEDTAKDIFSKITTDLEIEIINNKNEILDKEDIVGTGSKIRVKEDDKILREYTILIYGDVNGDGKINSVDLLVLQRHLLEIEELDGIYLKAANVRKTPKKTTSIDLLLIQRHILGLQFIQQ